MDSYQIPFRLARGIARARAITCAKSSTSAICRTRKLILSEVKIDIFMSDVIDYYRHAGTPCGDESKVIYYASIGHNSKCHRCSIFIRNHGYYPRNDVILVNRAIG